MPTIYQLSEPGNHQLGAGYLLFRPEGESGFRYLPESVNLTLEVETERVPLDSQDTPASVRLENPVVSIVRMASANLRQIDVETLSKFIAGDADVVEQGSETAKTSTFTNVSLGSYYQLGEGDEDAPPWGFKNVTVTASVEGASSPIVAGVDWRLDAASGMIQILPDAADVDEGDSVTFTFNVAATDIAVVTSGVRASTIGEMRFVSDNTRGKNLTWVFPRVDLAPSGPMLLKSRDTYSEVPLQFEILDPAGERPAIEIVTQ